MAVLDQPKQAYAVSISTASGPALFTSVEEWNSFVELSEYLAKLRSNRVGNSNKVRVSAVVSTRRTID